MRVRRWFSGGARSDGAAGAGGRGGGGGVLAGSVAPSETPARASAAPARLPQPPVPALSGQASPCAPPPAPGGVGSSSLLSLYERRRRTAPEDDPSAAPPAIHGPQPSPARAFLAIANV